MVEESLTGEQEHLLAALRRERGECPDPEVLAAFACAGERDGDVPQEAGASELAAHLELCPRCRAAVEAARSEAPEVDDVTWERARQGLGGRARPWEAPSERSAPTRESVVGEAGGTERAAAGDAGPKRRHPATAARTWTSLAAAAVLLAGGMVLWRALESAQTTVPAETTVPGSTVRGTHVDLLEPVGPVREVRLFAWNPLPIEVTWRLEIVAGAEADPVWTDRTQGATYRPSETLLDSLEPGRRYRWRIVGEDSEGDVLAESAWQAFEVASTP